MSSALVRQALQFVEQEESGGKRGKRRAGPATSQEHTHPYRKPSKKSKARKEVPSDVEDTVRKLLALSAPTPDNTVAQKIVERAVKGKPLLEKIEVKKEEEKSILFPEEPYSKFEREYFCS
uniref:Uncharacterized protein n=1 Tax=Pectinophora gossypiella TaxID=13191 RepID=A0A1E1W040_PECGO